jgi:hypothetical protein
MAFFKMLPQNFFFLSIFFSLILELLLFLCTFVVPHCVCVCPFPLNQTNVYLIATILTDMEQVVMIEFLTVTIKV